MVILLDANRDTFEEQDLQYIRLLEQDETFEEIIQQAREACAIGDTFLKEYATPELYTTAQTYAQKIIEIYSLPVSWIHPLRDFIVMGTFNSPGNGIRIGFSVPTDKQKGAKITKLSINITQQISFYTLLDWIQYQKTYIKTHLKKLPIRNIHFSGNFELRVKILALRRQGLKPMSIEKELRKQFPLTSEALQYIPTSSDISIIISKLKSTLKRTGKTKKGSKRTNK